MATREQIKQAVADEFWQEFRKKLKGSPTQDKLAEIEAYWDLIHEPPAWTKKVHEDCKVCIQVDNYLKALARGGQLFAGASLEQAFELGDITLLPVRK